MTSGGKTLSMGPSIRGVRAVSANLSAPRDTLGKMANGGRRTACPLRRLSEEARGRSQFCEVSLDRLEKGSTVVVTLDKAANVRLMDSTQL